MQEHLRALRALDAADVRHLLEVAGQYRAQGYDRHQVMLRHLYEGHGEPYVRAELARRYGHETAGAMPVVALNLARLIADVTSGAYDGIVRRMPRGATGPLAPDGVAARDFTGRIARDGLAPALVEGDRRLRVAGAQVYRLRPGPDRTGVVLYWPHQVRAIPDPAEPGDPARVLCVIAEVAGPGPRGTTWREVWARATPESSSWVVQRVAMCEDRVTGREPPEEYEGPLPWLWRTADVGGESLAPDVDRDVARLVIEINVALSDAVYLQNTQGHTPLVLRSNGTTSRNVAAWGPDRVIQIDTEEAIDALSLSPRMADGRALVDHLLRMLAITQGMPEDAYSHQRDYLSGDSRRAKHAAQRHHHRDQRARAATWEERSLWPTYLGLEALAGRPAPYSVAVHLDEEPPTVSLQERTQAAAQLVTLGLSPARAATRAGLYASIDEAVADGLPDGEPDPEPSE